MSKKGLELLREPFPDNQIGKLAKGSKAQMSCDAKEKKNCSICGGWHHPKLIHLDFVGHAALTDRLLDVDPEWVWEPLSYTEKGLPAFDDTGGLWLRLTVLGRSMIGYGNAAPSQYKEVGSREKEVIGDALRNAAMRMGAALELWHKGNLHVDEGIDTPPVKEPVPNKHQKQGDIDGWIKAWENDLTAGADRNAWWTEKKAGITGDCTESGAKLVYNEVMK